MRQPIRFIHRNLVFGSDSADAWALFTLATRSYAGQTRQAKHDLLAALAGLAYTLEADFQVLRVSRAWSVDSYLAGCETQADSRHAHPLLGGYLDGHRAALSEMAIERPEVFLAVRLAARESEDAEGAVRWSRTLRNALGLSDPRALSARRLEGLLAQAGTVEARIADYLDCEPASTHELQWLIRRAFGRSVSEPRCDERFLPQALVIDDPREGLVYPAARARPIAPL